MDDFIGKGLSVKRGKFKSTIAKQVQIKVFAKEVATKQHLLASPNYLAESVGSLLYLAE